VQKGLESLLYMCSPATQPAAKRLPVHELAKRENTKTPQPHCQWGGLGGLGQQGQGWPDSLPRPHLLSLAEPCMASQTDSNGGTGGGCMPPWRSTAPVPGTKKQKVFLLKGREGATSGDQGPHA
jgi:hypothetical protein